MLLLPCIEAAAILHPLETVVVPRVWEARPKVKVAMPKLLVTLHWMAVFCWIANYPFKSWHDNASCNVELLECNLFWESPAARRSGP